MTRDSWLDKSLSRVKHFTYPDVVESIRYNNIGKFEIEQKEANMLGVLKER